MSATRIRRHPNASRAAVYRALIDAEAVAAWMVPDGMTTHVHAFVARGGTDLLAVHDGPPPGLSPTENEIGWRMSLAKLAAFVKTGRF